MVLVSLLFLTLCVFFLDSFSNSVKLNQVHDISFVIYDLKILLSDIRREFILNGSVLESLPTYPTFVSGTIENEDGKAISWQRALIKYNDIEKNNNFESSQLVKYLNKIKKQFNSGKNIVLPLIAHYGTNRRWVAKERSEEKINREMIPAEYEVPRLRGYSNCLNASIFHLEVMRNWFARMLLIERKKIMIQSPLNYTGGKFKCTTRLGEYNRHPFNRSLTCGFFL